MSSGHGKVLKSSWSIVWKTLPETTLGGFICIFWNEKDLKWNCQKSSKETKLTRMFGTWPQIKVWAQYEPRIINTFKLHQTRDYLKHLYFFNRIKIIFSDLFTFRQLSETTWGRGRRRVGALSHTISMCVCNCSYSLTCIQVCVCVS